MTRPDIARCIDHTLLKADAADRDILRLCAEAKEHGFFAVCIPPSRVAAAVRALRGSDVRTCTVVGFPLGNVTTAAKVFEAREAAALGADECDMVIDIGAAKDGAYDRVEEDIRSVRAALKGKMLKVIIETGFFSETEMQILAKLSVTAGADFVKTSTGFGPRGATAEDIRAIRQVIGGAAGIKASGGIRTAEEALRMLEAGATRVGTSSAVAIMQELRTTKRTS